MRKYQRIVIGTLGVLVLGIIGLTVYGLQVKFLSINKKEALRQASS